MKQIATLLLFSLFFNTITLTQTVQISGTIRGGSDGEAVPGVVVTSGNKVASTDDNGYFRIQAKSDGKSSFISFYKDGYSLLEKLVDTDGKEKIDLGTIEISLLPAGPSIAEIVTGEDRIPIITLSEGEEESELGAQNISGILSAARDPFIAAAAFNLSTGGFDIRGYDAETAVLFNGMPFNSLENGSVYWSVWGGLNDVTRSRESAIDLSPNPYTFGGIGGYTAFDTRASEMQKGKRISYLFSNRAYNSRVMATWSTGMLKSGWAFSFSGSKRWANEGYVPGTFYDSYSYFASIDRKIGKNHLLNLTALGTPTRRGSQGAGTQELNDVAGTNFYNPHWGWQNGKKRNARVVNTHQPLFILRHDWKINERSSLLSAVGYQTGRYGRSNIDWFNAPDPRSDYYRETPVYFSLLSEALGEEIAQIYRDKPELLQVQWHDMYAANEVVDLQERDYFNLHKFFKDGNTPQGNMSQYILDEQRSDANKLNASTTFQSIVSDHLTVHAGLTWQQEQIHYFRTVKDLLGGDYYINLDRFVLSTPRTLDALYNPAYHASVYDVAKVDLDDENIVIREGDTYGWDYNINGQQFGTWLQGQFSFRKVDFFLAGQTTNTTFWRTGNMRNGKFPENSLGDSEKQDFINYSAKAGITYKIDGRNYIYANGAAITRPPDARIAYASPRNQDQLVPGLTTEKVLAWEAGFQHRSPGLKARATFFYSNINDGLKLNRFFLVEVSRFGTYVLSNVDRRHAGVELAFQAKITPTLSFTGAAAIGEYIYTSRPDGFFIIDEDGVVQNRGKSYLKNFYVPSVPQTALSGSLEYRSPKFWSASLTVNYFNRTYLDFSPERRTEDAVFGLEEGDELYNSIVNQQKAPDAFSVDLFAFKSFKVSDGVFFSLTGGVTNLLNAEIVQGGYEQLRFERNAVGLDVFPPRYFYAFGTNFFLMGALRF